MSRPADKRPSIEQLLDTELVKFDNLMAQVRNGIRSSIHFDELEAEATSISRGLRDAFRSGAR